MESSRVSPLILTQNYVNALCAMRDLEYDRAIAIFMEEPKESSCYVLANGNAALCYFNLEQFREAEELFEQVFEDIKSMGCFHVPSIVQFMVNHAQIVRSRGRRSEALERLKESLDFIEKQLDSSEAPQKLLLFQKAIVLQEIAVTFLDMNEPCIALGFFRKALRQHDILRDLGREGIAELLTNMAYALRLVGEPLKAEYALLEARDIVIQTEDKQQFIRIQSVLNQLSDSNPTRIVQAAAEAENIGQSETAFIRYCSAAENYLWQGNLNEAKECAESAGRLIPFLDSSGLYLPKFRNLEARLMIRESASDDLVANKLSRGAADWLNRLSERELLDSDFDLVSAELHEHFRLLSRYLKDLGDLKGALFAFEAGRALSTGRDVDSNFVDRVIRSKPFAECWTEIDTQLIDEVQTGLVDNEIAIAIYEIPPKLTAFVLKNNDIECIEVDIGIEKQEVQSWFHGMHMVPHQLKKGYGELAIPKIVLDLARLLSQKIGTGTVKRLVPYKLTHLVPWRAILRHAGVKWIQMPFPTEFGLLFPHNPLDSMRLRESSVTSMGFGSALGIKFNEDAIEFAKAWGASASYEKPCSTAKVKMALKSDDIVLISCHGVTRGERLFLQLQRDYSSNIEEVDAIECLPNQMSVPLLILSACLSGVYVLDKGDNPVGFAPFALRRGTSRVVCCRWEIGAAFAKEMVIGLASQIQIQSTLEAAFVETLSKLETEGRDLWKDLACVELLGQG